MGDQQPIGQPPRGPEVISTFKDALKNLTQFNNENQDVKMIEGHIGSLNSIVARLGSLNGNLRSMLQNITSELSKMKKTNLESTKKKLRDYISNMDIKINEIEKILPVTNQPPQPPQPPQAGGYKYTKSRSKSKSKSKRRSTRRRRRR